MRTIEATVAIPACWPRLLRRYGPGDSLNGIGNTGTDHPIGDPEPYVDDHRTVNGRLGDYNFALSLCSGMSNYYGDLAVFNNQGILLFNDMIEDFGNGYGNIEGELKHGLNFVLKVVSSEECHLRRHVEPPSIPAHVNRG